MTSCTENNTSSKDILLACMDWQCESLRISAFELEKARVFLFLFLKIYIYVP